MQGKTIVLGITGGIAAYKACTLISLLKKRGYEVWCVMTPNATQFITPLTVETLSGHPAAVDQFTRETPWDVEHIALAQRADLMVVAPATANCMAKFAAGIADDLLTTTLLAVTAPVLFAPAMNAAMWRNPATQANLQALQARGVSFVGPASGLLACGDNDIGRMVEPEEIADTIDRMLAANNDFAGRRVLVTAGPTREPLDPVRYITNHSSGKMGYALAAAAAARGAAVTLISGPTNLPTPSGVQLIPVSTTQQMYNAVMDNLAGQDLIIKAAAPADFTAGQAAEQKIKKTAGQPLQLTLVQTPDIAAEVGRRKGSSVLVVFAAETDPDPERVLAKLRAKQADMLVLNDVTAPGAGFNVDTNIVSLLQADGTRQDLPMMPKAQVAGSILDAALPLLPPECGA